MYEYLKDGKYDSVKKLLIKYPNKIDVLYKNGYYLRATIANNDTEMFSILLKYYEDTKLRGDIDNLDYKIAQYKLRGIINDILVTQDINDDIHTYIEKYYPIMSRQSSLCSDDFDNIDNIDNINNIDNMYNIDYIDNFEQKDNIVIFLPDIHAK